MTKTPWILAAAALGLPLIACGGALESPRISYVWTRTPGVAYVVVHPTALERKQYPAALDIGSNNVVDPRSEYVLLCDARRTDGMHCDVAYEAAVRRFSYTPAAASAAPAMEENVGTLVDLNIVHTAPSAAPPPPPPPPAPVVVPPPPPAGGKR